MGEHKVIRFEIEYDDGVIEFALGDDAEQIMRWYSSCGVMSAIHGGRYTGPQFQTRCIEPAPGDSGAGEKE